MNTKLISLKIIVSELSVKEIQEDTQKIVVSYAKEGVTPDTLHQFKSLYLQLCENRCLPLAKYVEYPEEMRDFFINRVEDYIPKYSIFDINDLEKYRKNKDLTEEQYEMILGHWIKKGIRGFINDW